jgi:hypothetical protein
MQRQQSLHEARRKEPKKTVAARPCEEHELLIATREQQRTPEWKKMYNKRAGIEGTFFTGSPFCGFAAVAISRTVEDSPSERSYCVRDESAAARRLLERNPTCLDTYFRLRSDRAMDHVGEFANGIP